MSRDGGGFAGLLVVDLHFPQSRSLKDKRGPVRSIRQHLRNAGFSVAEVGGLDTWQRCQLAISIVTRGAGDAEHLLDEALRICDRSGADISVRQHSVMSLSDFS